MGDPLSDPRAAWLLAADPAEVESLANAFRRVASQAHCAAAGLRGAEHDACWTGAAAHAFRSQLGKLPRDLDRVERSYGEVGNTLARYESEMAPLRSRFQNLAGQIEGMRWSVAGAQQTLRSADANLTTAAGAPGATPSSPGVVAARTEVHVAASTVGRLQGELAGLEAAALRLLDEFDAARHLAHDAVARAAASAPSESWLSGALHAVGNFLAGVAVNIGKSVWDLVSGHAIANFIEHPSWETFGTLVKDVAVTASLVAMVAAPFAAPELAAGDAAAAGADALGGGAAEGAAAEGASTLGTVARGVTTWAGRTSTGATAGGAVSDGARGRWGAAAVDAGFLLAPNLIGAAPRSLDGVRGFGDVASNLIGVGDRSAEAAGATARGMRDFQLLQSWGLNPRAASSLAFDGEPPAILRGIDPRNADSVRAAVQQARSAEVAAANRAIHIGRPVANLFDNLVTDPTHEAINHKLHLAPSEG